MRSTVFTARIFEKYFTCHGFAVVDSSPTVLGVQSDFDGWFGIRLLHVWLVMVRLRMEGYEGAKLQQIVFDQFWEITELRVSKLLEEGGMSKVFIVPDIRVLNVKTIHTHFC